eukprot:1973151-Pleurochrysis_carterae.AAC.1
MRIRCPPRPRLRAPPHFLPWLMPFFPVLPLRSRPSRRGRGIGRMCLLPSPRPQRSPMASNPPSRRSLMHSTTCLSSPSPM